MGLVDRQEHHSSMRSSLVKRMGRRNVEKEVKFSVKKWAIVDSKDSR